MARVQTVERIVKGPKSYSWVDPNGSGRRSDRKLCAPGTLINVTPAQAKAFPHRLIAPGVAVAEKNAEKAIEVARLEEIAILANENVVLTTSEDIRNAIDTITHEDDFTEDGKPRVKAIEDVLGYDISEAARDTVWDEMQEETSGVSTLTDSDNTGGDSETGPEEDE